MSDHTLARFSDALKWSDLHERRGRVANLIGLIMLRADRAQRVNVNRLSFADTLAWLRHGDLHALPRLKVNPLRQGRLEPRALKRQKKQFPYMKRPRAELKAELRAKHGDGT